MKEGDINKYIAYFNTLVQEAGYNPDDKQTLEKFTSGLPTGLYESIYQFDEPTMYKPWQCAAINQQKKWTHMQSLKRARQNLNAFKPTSQHSRTSTIHTPTM
jgi:hypothetical protein